jgi:glucokinase
VEPARKAFSRNLTGRGFRPAAGIQLAALGPNAGLIGAADLSRVSSRVRA